VRFKNVILPLILIIILTNCNDYKSNSKIQLPIVKDEVVSELYFSPNYLAHPICEIEYIGNIIDTIKTNVSRDSITFLETGTKFKNYKTSGFSLFVDTTQEVSINSSYFMPPPMPPDVDETIIEELIDSIFIEYNKMFKDKNYYYKGYPIFLINNSKDSIRINAYENRLMIIQEAKNPKGKWVPIEKWFFSGCGNVANDLLLPPKQIILSKVYKYQGNYETKLRLKMINFMNEVFYSNEFNGRINKSQLLNKKIIHRSDSLSYFMKSDFIDKTSKTY
jgi:hypothetical protein